MNNSHQSFRKPPSYNSGRNLSKQFGFADNRTNQSSTLYTDYNVNRAQPQSGYSGNTYHNSAQQRGTFTYPTQQEPRMQNSYGAQAQHQYYSGYSQTQQQPAAMPQSYVSNIPPVTHSHFPNQTAMQPAYAAGYYDPYLQTFMPATNLPSGGGDPQNPAQQQSWMVPNATSQIPQHHMQSVYMNSQEIGRNPPSQGYYRQQEYQSPQQSHPSAGHPNYPYEQNDRRQAPPNNYPRTSNYPSSNYRQNNYQHQPRQNYRMEQGFDENYRAKQEHYYSQHQYNNNNNNSDPSNHDVRDAVDLETADPSQVYYDDTNPESGSNENTESEPVN
jgi:hypothetical protein